MATLVLVCEVPLDAFAEHLRLGGFFFKKKKHFSRSWGKLDGEPQTLYNFEKATLVNRCKLISELITVYEQPLGPKLKPFKLSED